jgi:hypothetical protein
MARGRWGSVSGILARASRIGLGVILVGVGPGIDPALAQDERSNGFLDIPSRRIVDVPTAGLVPRGSYDARLGLLPNGGVQTWLEIGLANWIEAGASYGGQEIVGDGSPVWNPRIGLSCKVRALEETYTVPAVAVGIDTQGTGYYDDELDRYQFKSRGIFAVVSKNYAWLGDLGIHGGASRSLEDEDDGNPTFFVGMDKSLGRFVGLLVEYDAALNDDADDGVYGRGLGYMNAALRVTLVPQVELRLVARDLLGNTESAGPTESDLVVDEGVGREVDFAYRVTF